MPFLSLPAHDPDSGLLSRIAGFLLGISQDLFVAVLVLVLGLLIQKAWRRTPRVFAGLNAVLTAGVLGFLVFDFFLCLKTGVRMNLQFLEYVRTARCFMSSFEEMSPWALWLGLGIAMLYALAGYGTFGRGKSIPRPSFKAVLVLCVSLFLAPAATALFPPAIAYYSNNALFTLQHSLLSRAVSGGESGRTWKGTQNASPPMQEFSRAEIFERIDPAHPLLKRTTGFKGDRVFNLALEPGDRPHVVFLFMESFRAADIGVLGGKHGVSPHFDRLSSQGILFTRFHGNGIQTSRGMIASLYGILPRFSRGRVLASDPDMPLVGIPDLFRRRGYRTAYFHNGPLDFDGQDRFFPGHGFEEMHGRKKIRSAFPGAPETSWGVHDEYLMPYVVDWLHQQDRKGVPSFLTVLTMSNHHPWKTPPDYAGPDRIHAGEGEYGRFLGSVSYADHCLGLFWDLLRKNGLERRTVIFIVADTAQPMGEHDRNYILLRGLYQENLHIPLLILAEGRISEPKSVTCIGSQMDLLPTAMDLFQMQGVNHALGTSLVRQVEDRTVFFNNPYLLGYWGLRKNDHKYIYNTDTGRPMLYDLGSDPGETQDLASRLPQVSSQYRALLAGAHVLMKRFYSDKESLARGRLLKEHGRTRT